MPVHTFTSTTDLSLCTHDHHVEIVDGQARLKSRILLADDIGSVTRKIYEVIRGNVCARKTFRLSFTDIRQAEVVLRIDPITDDKGNPEIERILHLEINGHKITHHYTVENTSFQGEIDSYWSSGWEIVPLPVKVLKAGLNNLVIKDGGNSGWRLFIDTMRHYQHSH